jgi:gamma-glutamylcyclotransferase (GGCT)/AIG2-like uncharacterized protein YtfP
MENSLRPLRPPLRAKGSGGGNSLANFLIVNAKVEVFTFCPMPRPPSPVPDSGSLLFAYGSLLLPTGLAAVDAALARWTRPLGPAFMQARLYDLGPYPGLKPLDVFRDGPRGSRQPRVKGRLLLLLDPAQALAALDRYEEFHRRAPEKSEFIRAVAPVTWGKRTVVAQVYFYNRSARGRRRIASGDYLGYARGSA